MHYFYLTLFVLSRNAVHGSIYLNHKENVTSVLSRTDTKDTGKAILQGLWNYFQDKEQDDGKDKQSAQEKANILKKASILKKANILKKVARDKESYTDRFFKTRQKAPSSKFTKTGSNDKHNIERHFFHLDPVFNSLKTRRVRHSRSLSSSSSNTDLDGPKWMEVWNEKRLYQKFAAVNSSQPRGDVVNMKAARPWGFQCGDPNQYDHPWGTCMLPEECDGEYRIYRGDSFCGRNEFVCCALERTAYDMYQGLDLSFQRDDSLSTDTEDEQPHDSRISREKKRIREKRRRVRVKAQLKKKIRNSITNIIRELTKLLQKAYRNATGHRIKKTQELKNFIKTMKKQYKKDRNIVVDAHEFNMANYEIRLAESLSHVRGLNEAFMSNDTFRDIIVNGTVNKDNLLRLQKTHPVLSLFFNHRRMGGGDLESEPEKGKKKKDKLEKKEEVPEPENIKLETKGEVSEPGKKNPKLLEYDVEYGLLYY